MAKPKRGRRANYSLSESEWLEFARLVEIVAQANGYRVFFVPKRPISSTWRQGLAAIWEIAKAMRESI